MTVLRDWHFAPHDGKVGLGTNRWMDGWMDGLYIPRIQVERTSARKQKVNRVLSSGFPLLNAVNIVPIPWVFFLLLSLSSPLFTFTY